MIIELTLLLVSICAILLLYLGRAMSSTGHSFLFSVNFLSKMDDNLFDFITFIFKWSTKINKNVQRFFKSIPHRIIQFIHTISHSIAQITNSWIEIIKRKSSNK